MKLPNLSYMMSVGELRYIQAVYEPEELRNPDLLVRELLSPAQRLLCDLRGRYLLGRMHKRPFYYYVLARTRYYDKEYQDAVEKGVRYIVNIGCGADTRAYRFADVLKKNGVKVLECDQRAAIEMKQGLSRRHWATDHVEYQPIDLNSDSWPEFEEWMSARRGSRMLVLMEGVSPYVDEKAWSRLLGFLASELHPSSRIAYDFKLQGVAGNFGRSDRALKPFRLPEAFDAVVAYHKALGLKVDRMEWSAELSHRFLGDGLCSRATLFREDALVLLSPRILARRET